MSTANLNKNTVFPDGTHMERRENKEKY